MTKPISGDEYVLNHGQICPFCRSRDIENYDYSVISPGQIEEEMLCKKCERRWFNVYKLTGYSVLEE